MKFFKHGKDGGPESTVHGYWLLELKGLFSVALLRFSDGSRASYHSHAFDSISWLLRGKLIEQDLPEPVWSGDLDGPTVQIITEHLPGFRPIITRRSTFYRVFSIGTSWVLTFRGPWSRTWFEARPTRNKLNLIELAHGRKVVMP